MLTFGLTIAIALPFFLVAIFRGFVLTYLWAWFIVPLGMAPIGTAHAIGLSVLVSLLCPIKPDHAKRVGMEALEHVARVLGESVAMILAAWAIAFLAHLVMA